MRRTALDRSLDVGTRDTTPCLGARPPRARYASTDRSRCTVGYGGVGWCSSPGRRLPRRRSGTRGARRRANCAGLCQSPPPEKALLAPLRHGEEQHEIVRQLLDVRHGDERRGRARLFNGGVAPPRRRRRSSFSSLLTHHDVSVAAEGGPPPPHPRRRTPRPRRCTSRKGGPRAREGCEERVGRVVLAHDEFQAVVRPRRLGERAQVVPDDAVVDPPQRGGPHVIREGGDALDTAARPRAKARRSQRAGPRGPRRPPREPPRPRTRASGLSSAHAKTSSTPKRERRNFFAAAESEMFTEESESTASSVSRSSSPPPPRRPSTARVSRQTELARDDAVATIESQRGDMSPKRPYSLLSRAFIDYRVDETRARDATRVAPSPSRRRTAAKRAARPRSSGRRRRRARRRI